VINLDEIKNNLTNIYIRKIIIANIKVGRIPYFLDFRFMRTKNANIIGKLNLIFLGESGD
jgi:hypothetical protein